MEEIVSHGDVSQTVDVRKHGNMESYVDSRIKKSENQQSSDCMFWNQVKNAMQHYKNQSMPNIPQENDEATRGFVKRFPMVRDKVLSILRNDEDTRKNDLYLCLKYWVKCGMIKVIIPMQDFGRTNAPETISRMRRKLFEEARKGDPDLKFLLKEKEVIEMRSQREEQMKDYFGGDANGQIRI